MLRQASSRNQRSKGFTIKHALQIGLLVAVCIWLLYQVKHSHEKKIALLERRSNLLSDSVDKKDDFFKFGRKDLPQIEETRKVAENDETQEEEIDEDQDTRQDENVNEIEIDEEKEAKDDDIDEQDQEKGDEEEPEHLDESTEEEDKDNNDESNIEEEKDEHSEVDIFDNNQEREGSTQEAREENYKRDDASSAVVHDAGTTESESGAIVEKNIDEEPTVNKVDYDSDARGVNGTSTDTNTERSVNKILESETATNGTNDVTKKNAVQENFEEKIGESASATNGTEYVTKLDDTANNVPANETVQTNSANEVEVQNNSTVSDATTSGDFNNMDSIQTQYTSNNNTAPDEDAVKLQTAQSKVDVSANNTTAGSSEIISQNDNFADNSTIVEEEHETQNMINLDENRNQTSKNVDENRSETQEFFDNSAQVQNGITEEERDDRIDMSTLPQVQNEVMTSYDESTE